MGALQLPFQTVVLVPPSISVLACALIHHEVTDHGDLSISALVGVCFT